MIKKIVFYLSIIILSVPQVSAFGIQGCFLIQKNGIILKSEGDLITRYSPCSSFKIALALMGYDSGILKDETHPNWPFKDEYDAFRESWKTSQTPMTWMQNSCVWYSQVLTPLLGVQKFHHYITLFNYGNLDGTGDIGKNNGLTHAWLSSSLEISPKEKAVFLENLLENKLPVSLHAHTMTRHILYLEDLPNGWKLYGKTGSGFLLTADKTKKLDIKHGWFIGWIQKNDEKIIFVHHIVDTKKEEEHAGPRAKVYATEKLRLLIAELDSTHNG